MGPKATYSKVKAMYLTLEHTTKILSWKTYLHSLYSDSRDTGGQATRTHAGQGSSSQHASCNEAPPSTTAAVKARVQVAANKLQNTNALATTSERSRAENSTDHTFTV